MRKHHKRLQPCGKSKYEAGQLVCVCVCMCTTPCLYVSEHLKTQSSFFK